MRPVTSLLCLSVTISVCMAHICMISPPQRGQMDGLNKPGSGDCLVSTGPCGTAPSGKPIMKYKPGSNITVVFQKNLDHYVSATPGYFTVKLGSGTDDVQDLDRIEDGGEPSLFLYSSTSTLSKDLNTTSSYYVQVRYVSNNVNAPPAFFQCADIDIV